LTIRQACSDSLKQLSLSFKKHHKIKARNWFRNTRQWQRPPLRKRCYHWYKFHYFLYIGHWRAI